MSMRALVAAVAGVALLAGGAVFAYQQGVDDFLNRNSCEAEAAGEVARLDLTQARYASLIAATAERRDLPARAVTIALATAMQESKLTNPRYGDRDSQGLFQQRPSQGWGSVDQVRDARYATRAFFAALEQVDGYERMRVHVAAQRVQRSADGSAYAQHTGSARVLATALTGRRAAAFSCEVDSPSATEESPGSSGLTSTAQGLRREVADVVGPLPVGGFDPDGVTSGHSGDSAHYEGRAIDYFFRPVTDANTRRGWALASHLVANADRLGVATVIFSDHIWTARRSSEGWRAYDPGSLDGGEGDEVRRHLDHVHVDVA
jgi:hypothetical protein